MTGIVVNPAAAVVNKLIMEQTITIRTATQHDYPAVTALLQQEKLPVEDVDKALSHFVVATIEGVVAGTAGLELYSRDALLRSVAVSKSQRNLGLAGQLLDSLVSYAGKQGVQKLFLLTNTAEEYFERKGFTKIDWKEVPEAVAQSKEFNGLCPSSAVAMVRSL